MNKKWLIPFLLMTISLSGFKLLKTDWGFFGHRKLNRMAVFTLPPEMIGFYKKNIEYITAHSVDPDKRRYAAKGEAIRHYIDIDHWGESPFSNIPRNLFDAVKMYADLYVISAVQDSFKIYESGSFDFTKNAPKNQQNQFLTKDVYQEVWTKLITRNYFEEGLRISVDSIPELDLSFVKDSLVSFYFKNNFIEYGILPYHLKFMQANLEKAFLNNNEAAILKISAEIGHYIGDAHVPLHTTENYNGQFTDQIGIHGFWESRIPELFADDEYDFFVGKADYIEEETDYFWDIVLKSHSHLDSLLAIEKELSQSYPSDQIYCFEERNERSIRTYCTEYADVYHDRMQGMVEERMRSSILAIGSSWFTAWVNAGQPELNFLSEYALNKNEQEKLKKLHNKFKSGEIKGREHN